MMVVFDLTPAMMAAGAQLLTLLQQAKYKVEACAWVYQEEEGRWLLIISSPEVRRRGGRDLYRMLFELRPQIPDGDEIFRLGVVRACSDRDPLGVSLRKLAPRLHGKAARRLHYTVVDNRVLDDVYLYRVEPVPKARRTRRA
jgi:hypothetical protein